MNNLIDHDNLYNILIDEKSYKNILSDCNETRTHNHLVRKRKLNHFAKWLNDGAVL